MRIKTCATTVVYVLALSAGVRAQKASGPPKGFDLAKIVPELQESGFQSIFDGKSARRLGLRFGFLARGADGEIIGEPLPGHQPKQNIFAFGRADNQPISTSNCNTN